MVDGAAEGEAVRAGRGEVVGEHVTAAVDADEVREGQAHDLYVLLGELGLHAGGVWSAQRTLRQFV